MVPARAGSKRLPNKNKLVLGDKPLVSHSIDFAKHHHKIENVLVSTDDPEIQGIAVASGVMSPWLRPTSLSTDDSRIVDVLIHAINWYEVNFFPVFGVVLLQPTSPFRSVELLERAFKLYETTNRSTVISVSSVSKPISWCFGIGSDGKVADGFEASNLEKSSQEFEKSYCPNGSVYIVSPELLKKSKSIFSDDTFAVVSQNDFERVDIDTHSDLLFANFMHQNLRVIDESEN